MFAQAKSVFGTTLGIAALVIVFWVIGVVFAHSAGWPAVGAGIHQAGQAVYSILHGI